jgi:hypothetical protein
VRSPCSTWLSHDADVGVKCMETQPAGAAPVRSLSREERELMIAANNGYVLAFDNLSGVPNWLSDALCRLATGGSFAVRSFTPMMRRFCLTRRAPSC